MLEVYVTNAQGRQRHRHASGTLTCGRAPQGDGNKLVIDDIHVSRNQFLLEEVSIGKIRLENRGSVEMSLSCGTTLSPGDCRELVLPIRVSVGQTVLDIGSPRKKAGDPLNSSQQTLEAGEPIDVSFLKVQQIGKSYPYPLAYTYRLLRGIATPAELYKEQLRLAENLLAFVASVSLSLLEDEHLPELNKKFSDGALSCWQGGISPGDWLSLAIHATERLGNVSGNPLTEGLAHLQINKAKLGFGKCVRDLITAKNDHKHDRGPSIEAEYRSANEGVGAILDQAFEALNFFSNHAIRLVQDVNPRRRSNEFDVVFLKCMGDHPGFETEKTKHSQSLTKGDLYIELEPGRLMSLYPFIHASTCQQCKAREFYFVDRVDVGRSAEKVAIAGLKSFDRGHTEQDANIGKEITQIVGGA